MDTQEHGVTDEELTKWLNLYQRIAIVGGPGTGKSTLAQRIAAMWGPPVVHSDTFKGLPWDMQSDALLEYISTVGPSWVCEGITTARALRHGLNASLVIHLAGPAWKELNPQQLALTKKVSKWVDEVRDKFNVHDIYW